MLKFLITAIVVTAVLAVLYMTAWAIDIIAAFGLPVGW